MNVRMSNRVGNLHLICKHGSAAPRLLNCARRDIRHMSCEPSQAAKKTKKSELLYWRLLPMDVYSKGAQ